MPVAAIRDIATGSSPRQPRCTLEALYRDQWDFVVRVARRLGGRNFPAEDAAQEVFLVVERRLATYEPRARVTSWLYAITLNVVRGTRRRMQLESEYRADEEEGLEVPLVAPDPVEVFEAADALESIVNGMAPRKREVFLLAEFDELPCADIARIVGVKEATVWSRLHYARRELAAQIERWRATERISVEPRR